MKKLATAAIAAAAGTALVAGGVGTFAIWNKTVPLTAQHITAGSLNLTANSDGAWKDASGAPIDPTSYRIVPGAVLTYTQTLSVSAVGNGLKADLTFSGLAGSNGLAPYVTVGPLTATASGATDVSTAHDGSKLEFTSGTSTVTASVTVSFTDTGDTSGSASMNQVLDLSAATFTLTQVTS